MRTDGHEAILYTGDNAEEVAEFVGATEWHVADVDYFGINKTLKLLRFKDRDGHRSYVPPRTVIVFEHQDGKLLKRRISPKLYEKWYT